MKSVILILISILAVNSFAQKQPSSSDAIAQLKKLRYDVYVSKQTGADISKCKFVKNTEGLADDTGKRTAKTRAARNSSWPNDRLIYSFKIVTPKDKDGVVQMYKFYVEYRLSKCLSDGYGCMLMDDWSFYETSKSGPYITGAKEVTPELVISEVKSYLTTNKEDVLSDFYGYEMKNWIEINEITYPEEGSTLAKQNVINKNKRNAWAYIDGYRANSETSPNMMLIDVTKVRGLLKVELVLENGTWKASEIKGQGSSGLEKMEIFENTDLLLFYETFETLTYKDINNKRVTKAIPANSCGQIISQSLIIADLIYALTPEGSETLKTNYVSEDDYNKDLKFINYLSNKGYTYQVDSSMFKCTYTADRATTQVRITVTHPKFKGKVSKEMQTMVENNDYYSLYKYGKCSFFFDLDFTLVDNKWLLNSWCEDVFKNYDSKIINQ